jgi:hypothetical protein
LEEIKAPSLQRLRPLLLTRPTTRLEDYDRKPAKFRKLLEAIKQKNNQTIYFIR